MKDEPKEHGKVGRGVKEPPPSEKRARREKRERVGTTTTTTTKKEFNIKQSCQHSSLFDNPEPTLFENPETAHKPPFGPINPGCRLSDSFLGTDSIPI
jgi:hypothetical protein